MKKITALLTALACISMVNAQLTPEVTSWVINTTGLTGYNGLPANVQTVQYSDSNVYVSCSCIPGYDIGPWGNDPNIPVNKNFVFKITRYPTPNTGTLDSVGLGHVGVWSNGVSIDNAWDAQTYNNDGVWQRNALVFEGSSFDACLGHPQQGGEYHLHVSPKCLYDATDSGDHHSPIIGYMFDGYPVYGAYGYTNTNGTGAIKRMTPSYRTRNITTRTTFADGSTASVAGPVVNNQYPIGDFLQDYEYVQGLGDLDEHNGRFCVTPDYPNGTYAYFVTIDSVGNPVYPFIIGSTYYGKVNHADAGPGSGHVTITETTTTYVPTTGINETQPTIQYEITPNPTSGYVYLYMDASSPNNVTGKLYDITGRQLLTRNNLQPSIAYSFNLSDYPAGIYFLHLQTGDQQVVEKIVKIK